MWDRSIFFLVANMDVMYYSEYPRNIYTQLLTRYQEKWTDVTETSNDQSIQLCFIENALLVADQSIQFQAYTDLKFIDRCNS